MKYRILRFSSIPFLALLLAIAPTLPLAAQLPEGVRVTEDYQAWADGNHDGMLQPPEIDELTRAFLRFLGEPHPANNPLDTLFDENRDRKIGPDEIDHVWMDIILPRLQRLLPTNPEAARLVDLNDDGRLVPDEARLVVEYLRNPASMKPHKASPPVDVRIDANRDGRIGADEVARFREQLVRAAVLLPPEVGLPGGQWVIERRFLDVLADVNGSGELEPEEERWREAALGGPHTAKTAIDKRLDANHNGKVEQSEIDEALNTQRKQDERMAAEQKGPEAAQLSRRPRSPRPPRRRLTAAPAAASAPATTAAASRTSTATAAASTGVTLEQVSIDEIFPVFRSYYDDHPIGTAVLKNGGATALENVKVELGLAKYMDAKKPCTAPTTIAAGASGKVELTAVFNDEVLKISEGTKALATVTVSYTTGGQSVSKDFVQTVQFLKLNAMTWDDDDRAAAFVTANDPLVQQFRSAVVTNVDKACHRRGQEPQDRHGAPPDPREVRAEVLDRPERRLRGRHQDEVRGRLPAVPGADPPAEDRGLRRSLDPRRGAPRVLQRGERLHHRARAHLRGLRPRHEAGRGEEDLREARRSHLQERQGVGALGDHRAVGRIPQGVGDRRQGVESERRQGRGRVPPGRRLPGRSTNRSPPPRRRPS